MRRALIVLVLAALNVVILRGAGGAQQPRGAIAGQVVDGITGKPIGAAVVSLSGPPLLGAQESPKVLTGSDGRFVFGDLEPGAYTVEANKGGYAEGEPGRRRPLGIAAPVTLRPGQRSLAVVVPMWHYSAIAGTVTDDAGEPVAALLVRALARAAGGRQWSGAVETYTDDRGMYRFGALAPGEYLVVASPAPISANANVVTDISLTHFGNGMVAPLLGDRGDRGLSPGALVGGALIATGRGYAVPPPPSADHVRLYPPTFYPSTVVPAQAATIRLGVGEERSGVDVQIAPAAAVRVSGVLLNSAGPAPMTTVRLVPGAQGDVPSDISAPASVTDGEGRFTFASVLPGLYRLRSEQGAGSGPGWIDVPVSVADDDVDGIVATLRPPLYITAKTRYEGTTPPPARAPASSSTVVVPFWLESVDVAASRFTGGGVIGPDSLTMSGYLPGRYVVRVRSDPAGWTFKAALLDGVDVSATPFDFTADTEITLVYTDRPSGVSGRVDTRSPDAIDVLLFTSDAQRWSDAGPNARRFRSARVGARGEFAIAGVPPGDYYLVAVRDDQAADWRDPATLDLLARVAEQVSIADGETRDVALRVRDIQ